MQRFGYFRELARLGAQIQEEFPIQISPASHKPCYQNITNCIYLRMVDTTIKGSWSNEFKWNGHNVQFIQDGLKNSLMTF